MDPLSTDVLTFWFGDTDLSRDMERRDVWFRSTAEFDAELISRFRDAHERAGGGAYDHFVDDPASCLALVLMLDQFPRNIFRGSPALLAPTPRRVRSLGSRSTRAMIGAWPVGAGSFCTFRLSTVRIWPIRTGPARSMRILVRSALFSLRSTIARRSGPSVVFAHRNDVLGRVSSPEEEAYLQDPPLWGKTEDEVAAIEQRKAEQRGTGPF